MRLSLDHTLLAYAEGGEEPGVRPIGAKPRLAGIGGIIAGWAMVAGGAGGILMGIFYREVEPYQRRKTVVFRNGDARLEEHYVQAKSEDLETVGNVLLVLGTAITVAGAFVAMNGHSNLSESRKARRQWKAQRARLTAPTITPVVLNGGAGAVLSARF